KVRHTERRKRRNKTLTSIWIGVPTNTKRYYCNHRSMPPRQGSSHASRGSRCNKQKLWPPITMCLCSEPTRKGHPQRWRKRTLPARRSACLGHNSNHSVAAFFRRSYTIDRSELHI